MGTTITGRDAHEVSVIEDYRRGWGPPRHRRGTCPYYGAKEVTGATDGAGARQGGRGHSETPRRGGRKSLRDLPRGRSESPRGPMWPSMLMWPVQRALQWLRGAVPSVSSARPDDAEGFQSRNECSGRFQANLPGGRVSRRRGEADRSGLAAWVN